MGYFPSRVRTVEGVGPDGGGDVDLPASTLDDDSVTLAKLQNSPQARVFGRASLGVGDPELLTASQLMGILKSLLDAAYGGADAPGTLLADVDYRPGVDTTPGVTASVVDIDATNLAITFTVPDTGAVQIELSAVAFAGAERGVSWLLREGTTEITGSRGRVFYNGGPIGSVSTFQVRVLHRIKLTGLTPGDTHTYKWAQVEALGAASGGGTAYGPAYGAASMRVLVGTAAPIGGGPAPYNAGSFLAIDTYDGSDQPLHPDVVDFGTSWNGYRYWMAMTPYPGGDDSFENPSIVASADGDTWVVPAGLTNPIDPTPAGGHNADTELVYDGTSTLYCFYVDAAGTTTRILARASTDGITWGAETVVLSSNNTVTHSLSPTLILDGGTYKMWYVNSVPSPNTLGYRTSASPTSGWGAETVCTFDAISGRDLWHISVFKDGSTYRGLFLFCDLDQAGVANDTLHLASSADGLDWTVDPDPILSPATTGWDSGQIYRASGVINGTDLDLFYSAMSGSFVSHIGRTTIPLSAFPAP